MKKIYLALLSAIVFFIFGLATLGDYGISWDSPVHFRRGQTYLHFFLTGRTEFEKLEQKSFYQVNDVLHTGKSLKELDMGHPPLNDILSAVTNYIFYQKLGWLGDIEAHNLFIVLAGSVTVFFVFLFAYESFGLVPALFSSAFVSLYPLFWAESHFNIKDPPETAFLTGMLYFFWKSVKTRKLIFLIASSFFAGLALAVKFNVFFALLIVLPWVFYYKDFFLSKKVILASLFLPVIIFGILFLSWPYLWADPVGNFIKTINYYRSEGTNIIYQPNFTAGPFNFYPAVWIALTTPPVILVFLGMAAVAFKTLKKEKREVFLFWLLWFLIPIARVTLNKFAIYGGVRNLSVYSQA